MNAINLLSQKRDEAVAGLAIIEANITALMDCNNNPTNMMVYNAYRLAYAALDDQRQVFSNMIDDAQAT